MPPNPFTPSNTPWMTNGDDTRHYLQWSGVAKVWGANGYRQAGGQRAAHTVNWSTTPDRRHIGFRDHALDALVGGPVWIAPPDQADEVIPGLSHKFDQTALDLSSGPQRTTVGGHPGRSFAGWVESSRSIEFLDPPYICQTTRTGSFLTPGYD